MAILVQRRQDMGKGSGLSNSTLHRKAIAFLQGAISQEKLPGLYSQLKMWLLTTPGTVSLKEKSWGQEPFLPDEGMKTHTGQDTEVKSS